MAAIRAAVLTVSDTAAKDPTADRSGPAIISILAGLPNVFTNHVASPLIAPDDVDDIQHIIREWCSSGKVDLIITTGGTGFGKRDVTPEAISPMLHRKAPGLVHVLLSASLKHTPLAALSRPVAGTIENTLVVTLPGSVKAVKENMDALLNGGIIQHAVDLIRGGSGKQVHEQLATADTAGHQHHHHHHHTHQLPKARKSPYPLISLESALALIKENIKPLPEVILPVTHALRGYILAEDIHASQDVPATQTTNVDGYALHSSTRPGTYPVITSFKSLSSSTPLPPNVLYRINTGSPLPPGADAVLMVEDTLLASSDPLTGEEKEVSTLAQVPAGENIRLPGSDVRKGEVMMHKGEKLGLGGGGEVGTLVFAGKREVKVVKKPKVGLLSTGNEIVDSFAPPEEKTKEEGGATWGGVVDTNRPSLRAALESMGYEVVDLGIVPDDIDAHINAIHTGLKECDILLTTGGTSMGPSDLLKPIIERRFGGTIHFGRVTIKPGKPTTFGTIPSGEGLETHTPIFALPGNPASALVTFYVFVLPALRLLGGWKEEACGLPRVKVQLQGAMPLDPRTEFHRVTMKASREGVLKAFSTGGQRSSRVASLSGANGLVVLPGKVEGGPVELEAGAMVDAIIIGEIEME